MRVELGMHTAEGGIEITRGFIPPSSDKSLDKMDGLVIVVNGIDPLTDGAPVKVGATMSLEEAQQAQTKAKGGLGSGAGSGTAAESGSGTAAGSGGHSGGHHRGSAQ
jgi:hypothetical protein